MYLSLILSLCSTFLTDCMSTQWIKKTSCFLNARQGLSNQRVQCVKRQFHGDVFPIPIFEVCNMSFLSSFQLVKNQCFSSVNIIESFTDNYFFSLQDLLTDDAIYNHRLQGVCVEILHVHHSLRSAILLLLSERRILSVPGLTLSTPRTDQRRWSINRLSSWTAGVQKNIKDVQLLDEFSGESFLYNDIV